MVPHKQAGHMTCTRPRAERQILLAMRASSTHDPVLMIRMLIVGYVFALRRARKFRSSITASDLDLRPGGAELTSTGNIDQGPPGSTR